MASLVSPGVAVSVTTDGFSTTGTAGTVPLIVIATAANKTAPAGGLAPYTLPGAAPLYAATSQRDLAQSFGNPNFYSSGGTPLHGYELNEYGLHAAYSYLGAANAAYILRADIDLVQLAPAATPPTSAPLNGTLWLDLTKSTWGVFTSTSASPIGRAWGSAIVTVAQASDLNSSYVPNASSGTDGSFMVVPQTRENYVYQRLNGSWSRVGSAAWSSANPTSVSSAANPPMPSAGSTLVIGSGSAAAHTVTLSSAPSTLYDIATAINGAAIPSVNATVKTNILVISQTAGANLSVSGTALASLGIAATTAAGVFTIYNNSAQYPASTNSNDVWFKLSPSNAGAQLVVSRYDSTAGGWVSVPCPFYAAVGLGATVNGGIADGVAGNSSKDSAAISQFGSSISVGSLYAGYEAATGIIEIRRWNGSYFEFASYQASTTAPSAAPVDGTMWYNTNIQVDVMYCDGTKWLGLSNGNPGCDPTGVIVSGSAPTTQTSGGALISGDLWLDSSDLENYPSIYRWSVTQQRWFIIDNTDQTSPFGIVFADARHSSGAAFAGGGSGYVYKSQAIADMLLSNYVDPDAPNPSNYPAGMLLFNTRYSSYNVKVWRANYFKPGGFDPNTDYTHSSYEVGNNSYVFSPVSEPGRWVTLSGNKADGSPYMGRKAQRAVVVRAMAAALTANQDIRAESTFFNLISAPGYPELLDEMVELNTDQNNVAFICGDAPSRIAPTPTAITSWANNTQDASENGEDGLICNSSFVGLYYPWGLSDNTDGTSVMVPPSTMALRTMAYNDSVAYPWFAPAGFQRGLVANASSVGYLNASGEYQAVVLNQGQRDSLYTNKINAIAYMNSGLVVMGQQTLDATGDQLSSINVARLVNYVNYYLGKLVLPFLFQPNDQHTRDAAGLTVQKWLSNLVGLRAIEDFAVLCDATNNTPDREARKELWIDVVILPIRAIEFIYIPVRLRNQGESTSF